MKRNRQTFYDWCIENNELIYLENWDYEKKMKRLQRIILMEVLVKFILNVHDIYMIQHVNH